MIIVIKCTKGQATLEGLLEDKCIREVWNNVGNTQNRIVPVRLGR